MNEPTLHIVIGTAGSGKSTIARRLARQYAAAYLDKDAMSARFVEAALLAAGYDPGDRESNPFYRDNILPLEYDSLLDVPVRSHLHHRGRGALRLAAGRRRGGLRPRVPYDSARSATGTRPRARPVQARSLGRVLGRARGATLRLDRRSPIRILQRRT